MNQEIIYTIILILLGYTFKRFGILQEKDGEVISRIIFNITLPALIIVSFSSVTIEPSLIMLPIIVILYGFLSVLLAFFIFKNEEKEMKGTFMMLSTGYNVGLFAFPIVEAIWGAEGLLYFGMFDVGNSILVFGISYLAGSFYSKENRGLGPTSVMKKLSRSIPLMTYIVMSLFNAINIHFPVPIIDLSMIISKANMPLSLILLGIYLNFSFEKKHCKPILQYLLFRYGFALIFGLALYFLLPFNEMFRMTIFIGLLLPIGLSVIPYAHEFKYSTIRLVGSISNLCICISIILLYIFIFILA